MISPAKEYSKYSLIMKNEQDELSILVKEAKNGNNESLKKLLIQTEKFIYLSLYCLEKNECEISDIIQEALLKITKNIKKINETSSYKSWANKIALRCYYDHKRKSKRKKLYKKCEIQDELMNEAICEKQKEPIEDCINSELIKAIKDSISKLNEPYKLAIVMREFEGLSYDEIAKLTKTNVGTVKSRIARARCQLKEYMRPYMESK